MKYSTVWENPRFVGRQTYWQRLREIDAQDAAGAQLVMDGGKTAHAG